MKMGVVVFLIFYESAEAEHQAKDASHRVCRLSEGIATAAIGAAEAHADTEKLRKHKTNYALPSGSTCVLLTAVLQMTMALAICSQHAPFVDGPRSLHMYSVHSCIQ